ncbi:MAG: dihydrofolate reductase [Ignavibacteriaceae bacterium]|nr:dihydrofolate reductase [Ignavibacteriaceae bacterium]
MRKLILQMQITVNGYVAGPNGELDWVSFEWDSELIKYTKSLTNSFDTILLGRKMTDGFISHWTNVLKNPEDPEFDAAKKFIETPKVVFTKTLETSVWANTILAKGDLKDEISKIKNEEGKDIIVYGGAGFVSNLVKENLIDEYHLFVNPVAIKEGLTIFGKVQDKLNLKLVQANSFSCGITVLHYRKN